jgi:hypothetical protein
LNLLNIVSDFECWIVHKIKIYILVIIIILKKNYFWNGLIYENWGYSLIICLYSIDWKVIQCINISGNFATVFKAIHKED